MKRWLPDGKNWKRRRCQRANSHRRRHRSRNFRKCKRASDERAIHRSDTRVFPSILRTPVRPFYYTYDSSKCGQCPELVQFTDNAFQTNLSCVNLNLIEFVSSLLQYDLLWFRFTQRLLVVFSRFQRFSDLHSSLHVWMVFLFAPRRKRGMLNAWYFMTDNLLDVWSCIQSIYCARSNTKALQCTFNHVFHRDYHRNWKCLFMINN